MKTIENNETCTGCGACAFVCPTKAIEMVKDDHGFMVPVISKDKCVHCGKCVLFCHTNQEQQESEFHSALVLCGWHKSNEIRLSSSSGGAFSAIAEEFLSQNGIVYAHEFCPESKTVQCVRIESVSDLAKARTSKYVESDITKTFCEVKKDLESGRYVLVTGTPCQTAAIKKVFKNDERLLTVSLLCHGVSSPWVFQQYLREIENRNEVIAVNFRHKILGWHDNTLQLRFSDGKVKYSHYTVDPYYYLDMVKSLFLRDSCYACQYHHKHDSDITIGDYWNVKGRTGIEDDNKGISLMIANTLAGKQLLHQSAKRMISYELTDDDIRYAFWDSSNTDISDSIQKREAFMKEMKRDGFMKAAKLHMGGARIVPMSKIILKYALRRLHLRR